MTCFTCNSNFHAICEDTSTENKLATKTMITTFLAASTKNNFKFYCDKCLTNLEISRIRNKQIEQPGKKVHRHGKEIWGNKRALIDERR